MSASLLRLPTELRNEIIGYIFASHGSIHNPWYGLLLTNRTFHAEISDLLKDATLRVRIQPRNLHLPLADNLDLKALNTEIDVPDPYPKIAHFQTYCMRFGWVVFDVTATQKPTDLRLEPTYARKGKQIANALTAELRDSIASSSKAPKIEVVWGSFSRNVYMGITTWDCCVLKGMGSMMALSISRGTELSEVLYCAILLEERQRKGFINPLPKAANMQFPSATLRQRGGFGRDLAAKVRMAMHLRA